MAFKMKGFSGFKKTYKEAYAGLSAEKKAKQTEAEFTTAAKAWNKKTYGTTEPTATAKKASKAMGENVTKKDLKTTDYSAAIRVDEMNPKKSSAQLAKEKQAMQNKKDAGKFGDKKRAAASTSTKKDDRKYKKAEKKRSKADKAYAKGDTKKAERKLAKAAKKEAKGDKARKA